MEILLDSVLAFLSCVGLWTLGRLAFERLFIEYDLLAEDRFLKEDASQWTRQKTTTK